MTERKHPLEERLQDAMDQEFMFGHGGEINSENLLNLLRCCIAFIRRWVPVEAALKANPVRLCMNTWGEDAIERDKIDGLIDLLLDRTHTNVFPRLTVLQSGYQQYVDQVLHHMEARLAQDRDEAAISRYEDDQADHPDVGCPMTEAEKRGKL